MAKKFLTPLDLSQNELRNAVIQNLGSAPGSPVNGQIYYSNTGSHDVQARINAAWVSLVPTSLLGAANTWTAANVFNGAITGNNTINLTGTGTSSVGGTFTSTVHVASGITGATAASRYVGATASGSPASGTFLVGDFIVAQNGHVFVCTSAGTPGTWVDVAASAGVTMATSVVADTTFGASSVIGVSTNAARQDHSHGSPTHVGTDHSAISISSLTTPTGDVAWGSHRITNLLDPSSAQDAATKNYVDNSVAGLAWKDAVRVASTANLAVASAVINGAVVDGVTLATGDRILLKNQTTSSENGIYVVAASGTASRATDADAGPELQGATAYIQEGTAAGGTTWTLTTTGAITVGTTGLSFSQFSGASTATAGAGLTATGNVFAVGAGTGISVAADAVAIDTTLVARKFTQQIGNGSLTSIAVTHSLANQWCNVQVFNTSAPFDEQECDIQLTDANTVTLLFTTAPTTNALRVVVTG